jgi:hypothetical protein
VLILLGLAIVSTCAPANLATNSPLDIETRIVRAISFAKSQFHTVGAVSGYLHDSNDSNQLSYTEDNALVALALASYQETHFSASYYSDLQNAVAFVIAGQGTDGDFYQYYNYLNGTWKYAGKFYYWNSFILMSLGYTAFTITSQVNSERLYWSPVVERLRSCIDAWVPSSLGPSGGVLFASLDGRLGTDLRYQGALLMGLIYLAAYEYSWGSSTVANRYANYAKKVAAWLYPLQEHVTSRWGYGGFYSNATMNLQTSEENAFAMFGLISYYKGIALLMPDQQSELGTMRDLMQIWEEGYVESVTDPSGAVSYGRDAQGLKQYPRPTWTTSAMLADTVDVWINLGPPRFWNDSSRIYAWLTGTSGRSIDMQSSTGSFYAEESVAGGPLRPSDLATSMLALYAVIRTKFVKIPGTYPVSNSNPPKFTRPSSSNTTTGPQTTMSVTQVESPESTISLYYVAAGTTIVLGALVGIFALRLRRGKRRSARSSRSSKLRKRKGQRVPKLTD